MIVSISDSSHRKGGVYWISQREQGGDKLLYCFVIIRVYKSDTWTCMSYALAVGKHKDDKTNKVHVVELCMLRWM